MRAETRELLSERVNDPDEARTETYSRLGISLPALEKLTEEIESDLSGEPPFGIGWWKPTTDSARRILSSDYLYACTSSVAHHLLAARLHQEAYLACKDNGLVVSSASFPGPSRNALEWIEKEGAFGAMHRDGVLRALASALDCLAGSIIAVCAVRTKVKKAGFTGLRSHLRGLAPSSTTSTEHRSLAARNQLLERLEAMIEECGPPQWMEWMLDFRNMLVHRGRRIEISAPEPASSVYNPHGQIARWSENDHLPRDPSLSDVEAILSLDALGKIVLAEHAEETLGGLLNSTKKLICSVSDALLEIWILRRKEPDVIQQPFTKHWSPAEEKEVTRFTGYVECEPVSPDAIKAHQRLLRRIQAAAVDETSLSVWEDEEMAPFVPRRSEELQDDS